THTHCISVSYPFHPPTHQPPRYPPFPYTRSSDLEEYEHMKWHPIFGCEVIEEIDFLRDGEAVNAVRHHHERLDGRGYPDNLFGEDRKSIRLNSSHVAISYAV